MKRGNINASTRFSRCLSLKGLLVSISASLKKPTQAAEMRRLRSSLLRPPLGCWEGGAKHTPRTSMCGDARICLPRKWTATPRSDPIQEICWGEGIGRMPWGPCPAPRSPVEGPCPYSKSSTQINGRSSTSPLSSDGAAGNARRRPLLAHDSSSGLTAHVRMALSKRLEWGPHSGEPQHIEVSGRGAP